MGTIVNYGRGRGVVDRGFCLVSCRHSSARRVRANAALSFRVTFSGIPAADARHLDYHHFPAPFLADLHARLESRFEGAHTVGTGR